MAVVEGQPDAGEYIDSTESKVSDKWDGFFGFLDGIRGTTDRVEAITGDLSGIAGDIAQGKRALWEQRAEKAAFEQDQFLELAGFQRGDNIKQYWVIGAVALGLIVLFK